MCGALRRTTASLSAKYFRPHFGGERRALFHVKPLIQNLRERLTRHHLPALRKKAEPPGINTEKRDAVGRGDLGRT